MVGRPGALFAGLPVALALAGLTALTLLLMKTEFRVGMNSEA